ncbi:MULTISPECIES: hypothetical protein [unclassified Pseudomonas]|uniref:hypothetical protein n=1 Tax=unclassified Pseudomonas TaxID=196821 RepID=UPI0011404C25|nr:MULTISPECIES: hypothetical protein [unclassified Pseudomonas]
MLPRTKGWLSVDTLSVPLGGGRTARKPFWIVVGAHALVLSVASLVPLITESAEPELTLSAAEILLRDVPPELAFEGALLGKPVHFVVQDCKVYRINGALKNREALLVVEPEFYPFFTVCDRQFLKAEGAAVTVWLGRMAFGAGGCCATGGTFRTTDGRVWKKISNDSSPWRAAELNGN